MYTKKEENRIAGIISQIARNHHITEEQVRADMIEAMEAGRNNPDPAVQARWREISASGEELTLEDFILSMVSRLPEDNN